MSNKIQMKLRGLTFISLIGACISLFQTHHFYSLRQGMAGFSNLCSFGAFDCNAVEMSRYAELAWGFPLSALAAAWFFTQFVLSLMAKNPIDRSPKIQMIRLFSIIGLITSIIYLLIMALKLNAFCSMCMLVDACIVTILALSFSIKAETPLGQVPKKFIQSAFTVFLVSAAGSALISLMFGSSPISQAEINREVDRILARTPIQIENPEFSPSMGSKDAPVTIVKFSDFQCPACLRGAHSIHPLFSKYRDKIRFVFRNFPLDPKCNRLVNHSMHPSACIAAKAALCLHSEGKFKDAYEQLFEDQESMTPKSVVDIAKSISSNPDAIEQCMESEETAKNLYRDIDEGERLDIMSTPTFFINGRRIEGALPTKAWVQLVDKMAMESAASK